MCVLTIYLTIGLAGDWLSKSVACIILLIERLGTSNITMAKVGLCQVSHYRYRILIELLSTGTCTEYGTRDAPDIRPAG
jgi:hypothetical protein